MKPLVFAVILIFVFCSLTPKKNTELILYTQSKNTTITFCNNSAAAVDSVIIFVNNFQIKLENIAPNATTKTIINNDSIQLNNHDLVIRASIFVKGKPFSNCYHYNDLYGEPDEGYKLLLKADATSHILPEY